MRDPIDPENADSRPDLELVVDRYLAGTASASDLEALRQVRERDPAWAAVIEALRSNPGGNGAAAPEEQRRWDADAAWARLQSRIVTDERADVRSIDHQRRGLASFGDRVHAADRTGTDTGRASARRWLIAAGLVLAAGVAAWRILSAPTIGDRPATVMREVVTPNGVRHTLTLDDGSRVTLNAGSRLRWAEDFATRTRDVFLEGEAYFIVAHDASRPFRVHARGGVAHDLGTRFTMRAYSELPHLEVVVAEGSVSLRRDHAEASDSAILTVGQLGRLTDAGPPVVESNVPVERWTAWTGGALVLDGQTLADALPQLERWYDAKIVVSDPRLAARRVSARFMHETLPEVLDALSLALGARWEQSGRSITLSPVR